EAGQKDHRLNMLAYVVWAAMFSIPPLLLLSLVLEGPAAIADGIARATPVTWAAVLWQSVGNTMFGYACWAWLLSRYPAATVAPMSLLVPVFGFAASASLLGEPLPLWKIGATLLIMAGPAGALLCGPPQNSHQRRSKLRPCHDAVPPIPARRWPRAAGRLHLGHQFRGGALGPGKPASLADGGHPLCTDAISRHPFPQKAQRVLGTSVAVRHQRGNGTIRAPLYRHERFHLARHRLGGDADPGFLHHRGRGPADRREAAPQPDAGAAARRRRPAADPDA